jgi:hypothetical protein
MTKTTNSLKRQPDKRQLKKTNCEKMPKESSVNAMQATNVAVRKSKLTRSDKTRSTKKTENFAIKSSSEDAVESINAKSGNCQPNNKKQFLKFET